MKTGTKLSLTAFRSRENGSYDDFMEFAKFIHCPKKSHIAAVLDLRQVSLLICKKMGGGGEEEDRERERGRRARLVNYAF